MSTLGSIALIVAGLIAIALIAIVIGFLMALFIATSGHSISLHLEEDNQEDNQKSNQQ